MSNTTDERLIEAIRRNDYVSYNKLFERYYGRLCQYVYSLLMDKSDTEDIVQELFLNIWKNRERIEIKENVGGYLYKMAKHLALNHLRSKVYFNNLSETQDHMKTSGSSLKNFGSLFIAVSIIFPVVVKKCYCCTG